MSKETLSERPQFSHPVRAVLLMLAVVAAVIIGADFAYGRIYSIFSSSPYLNGLIIAVFLLGLIACFWQVVELVKSVRWIENVTANASARADAPQMLAPLAALLDRDLSRRALAPSSARSILDSVATRIDEGRDITRYLASLLIFLGLLGTFYGLATTVPGVVDTIRALAPKEGEGAIQVFDKLMSGLETQLGGMGTAFSSSLIGLAGSLVVGLLEIFVTHGQNRFYRELEDWIGSLTRLSFTGAEGGDGFSAAAAVGVLDHMSEQMDGLHAIFRQSDLSRGQVDERMARLVQAVEGLTSRVETMTATRTGAEAAAAEALRQIAEGQHRLAQVFEAKTFSTPEDSESRMRLRSIDVQLLKLLEEVAAGRQESMSEIRADIATLVRAILARDGAARPRDGA